MKICHLNITEINSPPKSKESRLKTLFAMRSVKVTYSNGDVIETDINGTDAEILAYFRVGRQFNLGNGRGGDLMATVVKAEITR